MVNPRTTTTGRGNYRRAVGVFRRREDIEGVIRALKDSSYDMDRVSLIAKDIDAVEGSDSLSTANERGETEAQEGAGIGASTGAVFGGIGGLLLGIGALAIPGIGPAFVVGAELNALATTLAGAGIGAAAGGIVGALVGLGIPEEHAQVYNDRVKAGQYLLMVSGTDDELRRVESILRDRNIEEFNIYDAPDVTSTQTTARPNNVTTAPEPNRVVPRQTTTTPVENRPVRRDVAASGHDLNNDGEPEVMIVDNRDNVSTTSTDRVDRTDRTRQTR